MKQFIDLFIIISIAVFISSCALQPSCDMFIGDWENIHPNGPDATTSLNIKKDGEVYLITVWGYRDGTDYGIKLLSKNISASCQNGEL